jgi:hypothetical protein
MKTCAPLGPEVLNALGQTFDDTPLEPSSAAKTMLAVPGRSILIRGFINTEFETELHQPFLAENARRALLWEIACPGFRRGGLSTIVEPWRVCGLRTLEKAFWVRKSRCISIDEDAGWGLESSS